MRLKYYKLTLRQMGISKPFVFFILFLSFIIFVSVIIINKNLKPTIIQLCKSNAKSITVKITNEAVYECIKNLKYEDLVKIEKDDNNKITSLSANVIQMNIISTNVSLKVDDELNKRIVSEIKLPLLSMLGINSIGGYGPIVTMKTIPTGSVDVKFKSDFMTTGINQTKHTILIEVLTSARILAPFYTDIESFKTDIVVAETVIIGEIPEAYYDIDGESVGPMDIIE